MDVLDAVWEAARVIWPDIAIARAQFDAFAKQLDATALATHPGDVYLAAACLAAHPVAVAAFETEHLGPARAAMRSIVKDDHHLDEACQRLRVHLLAGDSPKIAGYAGRGPLRAWVGIAAMRTALMMRRSQMRMKELPPDDDDWSAALAAISTGNPELELLKQAYATVFPDALRQATTELEPRLRTVLRMSFVDAMSIDEIGAVYHVHRATAARWIQRACDAIFTRTHELLGTKLSLTPSEVDQMTALIRSQLEISLSQLLPADALV